MATNTAASFTNHTGNGSTGPFNISFSYLSEAEVDVTVGGVLKTITTHYTFTSATQITFTSGNEPANGVAIKFQRDTNITAKKVDFVDGSVLTETDLDTNSDQVLFAQQEIIDKLNGIEDNATQDQTAAEIKTLIASSPLDASHLAADSVGISELAANSVDSDELVDLSIDTQHIANEQVTTAKLAPDAVTSAKLADNAVDSEHYVDGSVDHVHLANDAVDGDNIADDSINSEHYIAGSIDHEHLANDIVDGDNIQDSVINSEHYVDGSIDREHLAADIVDGTKIADDSIDSEHIVAGSLDNEHYAAGSITSDKLNGATVVTASEQSSAASNDTSFLTVAAADARFFNVSSGDTIKDGDTFPDNDTTIATTAAINDRIIDLVDDVGGFVPIANETSFPTANPDVNNGTGTIVSISAASTNLTPSGTTVTIANGAGSGNTVTITGVPSVISSGFGFLVETTTTLHTYTFHRLSPKATEVTTVAGISGNITSVANNTTNINAVANNASNINTVAADASDIGAVAGKTTEIGRLGTADAVADMALLGTTDIVADMNLLATSDVIADMNLLATSDVIADMALLAVSDVISDMNDLATSGNITAMSTCSTNISSINNASSNISSVNNFGDKYQVASSDPSTDGGGNALAEGDLYFNTTADELKVYNGSAWQGGVTASGNFAVVTGNTFTGSNIHNDNVKSIYGTSSDGLEIFHNASDSVINDQGTGSLKLQTGGSTKIEVTSTGTSVTGNITVSGNVDGRDVAADGTKLDGIETSATADQTASEIVALVADQTIAPSEIDMEDNEKIKLGTSDDLKIYHDGSNSYLTNATGIFRLRSDDLRLEDQTNGHSMITAVADGAVSLSFDNSVKLATTNTGATVTGQIISDGLSVGDSDIVKFGSHDDLQIYHDGTHSRIDEVGTGNLMIQSNNAVFIKKGTSENIAEFNADGAVKLYFDNTQRIETSAVGANISGNLSVNDGQMTITHSVPAINFEDNSGSSGNDFAIQVNGNQFKIVDTDNSSRLGFQFGSDGNTQLGGNVTFTGNILANADSTHSIGTNSVRFANGYFDTLYGDGSNLTGVSSVGGATGVDFNDGVFARFGTGNDLILYHNGNDGQLANSTGNLILANSTDGEIFIDPKNNERGIVVKPDLGVEIFHNNIKKLETESSGINVISSTPLLNFNANNVAQCAQFQVSESSGGGVLIVKNKHTSGNLEEAYRINNDGTFSFSGAGTMNSGKLNIANNGTHITCKSFATGGYDSIFFRSANTNVGKIHFNSGGTQYHTSSDYRRKENVVDLTGAIDRVKLLKPKRFNFITDNSTTLDGFLAHEVTPAVPQAILGEKDAVETTYYEEGDTIPDGKAIGDVKSTTSPVYQTIDHSTLVPLLTAGLQEAIAKIETLETKVAALEAA